MNRIELGYAYSVMPLQERKQLAEQMGHSMSRQYQYFMRPSSDKIGKERMEKLLAFKSLSYWKLLANQGAKKAQQPINITINIPGIIQPDVITLNGVTYLKQ
ncbi:hypothetical protein [Clostridium sp.]|uniref:hypothetical protein n=1 Tax=Clostridium sp. TaxID=1506 RepID=UPI0026234944|nr:hypothetical protein [Clostridium sp.]